VIIPQWPAPDNVKALATGCELPSSSHSREGLKGVSLPPYQSFNLGDHVNDDPLNVAVNRQQLLSEAQGCEDIRWLQQVHGTDCLEANSIDNGHQADASYSDVVGQACAVMTADCLPVLFCDLQGSQVAAAHAGWRGLAEGVLINTLQTFTDKDIPLDQVIAWLGPAISQSAFEVGPEVKRAFSTHADGMPWADGGCFVVGGKDRWQADLYRLAKLQLEKLGVNGIYGEENFCTYSNADENNEFRFFSYRRQSTTGRQASLIWLV